MGIKRRLSLDTVRISRHERTVLAAGNFKQRTINLMNRIEQTHKPSNIEASICCGKNILRGAAYMKNTRLHADEFQDLRLKSNVELRANRIRLCRFVAQSIQRRQNAPSKGLLQ